MQSAWLGTNAAKRGREREGGRGREGVPSAGFLLPLAIFQDHNYVVPA